jgi:hypothetical protein
VLVHVKEREQAIRNMAGALKPGGWVLFEEFDAQSMLPNPQRFGEHYLKTMQAFHHATILKGVDTALGRRLPGLFRASGLDNIGAEGRTVMAGGGSPGARVMRANYEQIKADILATGLVTEQEFAMDLERIGDPAVMWPMPTLWSVWGQRPR